MAGALNKLDGIAHRREALWQVERAGKLEGPLLRQKSEWLRDDAKSQPLRQMNTEERLVADYAGTGLTVGKHPMYYLRSELQRQRVLSSDQLRSCRDGEYIRTAGCIIARQRPGTAKGFIFLSMEDETGTYIRRAIPLTADQKTRMAGFFTPQLLDETRLLVLSDERVANPDFYSMLRHIGFDDLPDQSTMAAITFADCVVSHGLFSDGLLFHELVHVEQFRQLGVPRFADLYLRGFLKRGSYIEIPLERFAYSLGEQYESDPTRRFSVADEVTRWVSEGRF